MPPPSADPYAAYNPLDSTILAPWQQAADQLAREGGLRNQYQYRRRAGNLGNETGIQVLEGQTPTTPPPPGAFYDYNPQVNRHISDILGAQSEYRNLGPEQDIGGDLTRVAQIGSHLQDLQRINDLALQRQVAFAGTPDPSTLDAWNAEYNNLLNQRNGLTASNQGSSPQMEAVVAQMNNLQNLITQGNRDIANARQKAAMYDAEVAALKERVGGATEADLRTELARRQVNIKNQDTRVLKKAQVANLATLGVPNLSQRAA